MYRRYLVCHNVLVPQPEHSAYCYSEIKKTKMINRGNKRHFVVDKISNNKTSGITMKKHKRAMFTMDDTLWSCVFESSHLNWIIALPTDGYLRYQCCIRSHQHLRINNVSPRHYVYSLWVMLPYPRTAFDTDRQVIQQAFSWKDLMQTSKHWRLQQCRLLSFRFATENGNTLTELRSAYFLKRRRPLTFIGNKKQQCTFVLPLHIHVCQTRTKNAVGARSFQIKDFADILHTGTHIKQMSCIHAHACPNHIGYCFVFIVT